MKTTLFFLLTTILVSSCLVDEKNQPVSGFETKVSAIVTGNKDERKLVPSTKYVDASTVAIVDSTNATVCTGTTIGPSFILTAAHCVYNIKSKQYKVGLTVIPGLHQSHGYKPYSRFHIKRAFLLKDFIQDLGWNGYTGFAASKDIAILQLREFKENRTYLSDISKPVKIGFSDEFDKENEKFEVFSYTSEVGKEINSQYYQHGGCKSLGVRDNYTAIYHDCDTGPSSSGMALVRNSGGEFKIFAIHSGGSKDVNSAAYFPTKLQNDIHKITGYEFDNLENFVSKDLKDEPFFGFDLQNNCDSPMEVAVSYHDIEGKERVHGVVTIESGDVYMAELKARTNTVKVYGKTINGSHEFKGSERITFGNQTFPFFNYELKGMYEDGLISFKCN
ncbi:MAG: S1 family peptidase [Halobacteriovoraceae bacterium]|nr:S1 family peptidase [Halobacteriovoraceae bacterium]